MTGTQRRTAWNKGLPFNDSVRQKMSFAKIKLFSDKTNHPRWKGGLPKCLDCGRQLGGYQAKRCRLHAFELLRKGNRHGYEHGYKCEICEKPTINGYIRCKSHRVITEETRQKFRTLQVERLKNRTWKNQYGGYIENRNDLKRYAENNIRRTDPAYNYWSKKVKERDGFKCRIDNQNCDGRIETHHILGWTEYVELRYEINNGITLCHAHHPRKRAEEKRLIPVFRELMSVSSGSQRQGQI